MSLVSSPLSLRYSPLCIRYSPLGVMHSPLSLRYGPLFLWHDPLCIRHILFTYLLEWTEFLKKHIGLDDSNYWYFFTWTLSSSSLHNFLIWKTPDFNLWVNCHKIIICPRFPSLEIQAIILLYPFKQHDCRHDEINKNKILDIPAQATKSPNWQKYTVVYTVPWI